MSTVSPPLLPVAGLSGGTLAASGHAPRRSAGERGGSTPRRCNYHDLPIRKVREAWTRHLAGVRMADLAAELDCGVYSLARAWKACGFKRPPQQDRKVLQALAEGPKFRRAIVAETGIKPHSVSALLSWLHDRDLVTWTHEVRLPGARHPARFWTITDAGRAWLAEGA